MESFPVHKETRLKGLALSEGLAVARVCLFNDRRHNAMPVYRVREEGIEEEIQRFDRAVQAVGARLDVIRDEVAIRVGPAEAEIFAAQKMILADGTTRERVVGLIRQEKVNAEQAVSRVLDEYETRLLAVDNQYMKERASDFGEIKRRLLDVFGNMRPDLQCAVGGHCQRGNNRVVVAETLTPALTVDLDMEHLMGLITEHGGANSHGAILARGLGIPAVSGLRGIRSAIGCGTEILVNGTTGEVVVWPSEETVAAAAAAFPAARREPAPHEPLPGFRVMANIRSGEEVAEALRMRADGIGLFRTELEVIASNRMLTEDELFESYRRVWGPMHGQQVVFRMFDFGSDKKPPFATIPAEENPQLGWRGSRYLLDSPDVLRIQARALGRLSREGTVYVMYPMVTGVAQFRRLKAAFEEAIADLGPGEIRHGVMLEVPAACLDAEALLHAADFASVGTNDLTQYLLAVDRDNELVAQEFSYDTPVLWRMLSNLAKTAASAGKELSVCGEMAGDPKYTPKLIDAGIRSVSVSARRISSVRAAVAKLREPTTA